MNKQFILNSKVKAYQQLIPEKVEFNGKERVLTEEDKMAIGRAVWFVIKKGWGRTTTVQKVSGSFDNVPTSVIDRGLTATFPENFFQHWQQAKNKQTAQDLW